MLDSHDMSRIAYQCEGDMARVSNALAVLMLMRGIPVIQYGTEFAFNLKQRDTRLAMWPTHFNASAAPLYELVRKLNLLRKEHRLDGAHARIVHIDHSSVVLLRGSEAYGVWLFANAWPATQMNQRREYCVVGLGHAVVASPWVDVLSGSLAEFTASGCYVASDGMPKVLVRGSSNGAVVASFLPMPLPQTPPPLQPQPQQSSRPTKILPTECSASARRALAERGSSNPDEWKALGACLADRVRARHTLFFVHLSKAGGTSFCKGVERQHGCMSASFNTDIGGCWTPDFDDGPRWIPEEAIRPLRPSYAMDGPMTQRRYSTSSGYDACLVRKKWADGNRVNLMATETSLSESTVKHGVCNSTMTTLTLLRDPVARLHAHYRHVVRLVSNLQADQGKRAPLFSPERVYKSTAPDANTTATPSTAKWLPEFNVTYLATRLLPRVSDNFYTRTFAGETAWRTPFGALTESHLAVALSTLRSLDWVILLGDTNTQLLLERGLGLADGLLPHERQGEMDTAAFPPHDIRFLSQVNRFDQLLFNEAMRLNALDVASLKALQIWAPETFLAARSPIAEGFSCCGYACQPAQTRRPSKQARKLMPAQSLQSLPSPVTPQKLTIDVYDVLSEDGETHARGYFEWFIGKAAGLREEVRWRWHQVDPTDFFDGGEVNRAQAGSVVLVQSYHLHEPVDRQFLVGTLPEKPLLLRSPRVWALLNASEPLIILLHNDGDCSLEFPRSSHHVFYRDTWSEALHKEFVTSRALEPGKTSDWPWLRSFPFGSPFQKGNLSQLAAARTVRADERRLLFAFRGTRGWSKPSRQLLQDAEAKNRVLWTAVANRLMAHAPVVDSWHHPRGGCQVCYIIQRARDGAAAGSAPRSTARRQRAAQSAIRHEGR